jgi:hypothetical protein
MEDDKWVKDYWRVTNNMRKSIETLEARVEKYEHDNNCILVNYIDMFTLKFKDLNTGKIFIIQGKDMPDV